MERPVLIIEAPEMDDEQIMKLHDFLYELIRAFEGHYYQQLSRYEHGEEISYFERPPEGEDPF